jgi:mRNA interferase MazF
MPDPIRRGDVVWANMAPTKGREQSGHRPHLVLSDERLHRSRAIAIVVPLTTSQRPWPTRVAIAPGSFAICEQPITIAVERITQIEHSGYDTAPVVAIIDRLIRA